MSEKDAKREKARERKMHCRDTLRMVRGYLRPQEPDPEFSLRLEELCESMGAEELFLLEAESREDGSGRRGIIIGGAIASTLPFLGVAAYALRKHILRRRVIPMGV